MSYNSTCDDDDYYAILGVPYNADSKAIRKAYLKLSLQYHPDKNTNNDPERAQAAFVRIGRAYQTLSDPTQRRIYDQTYRTGSSSSNSNSGNNRYRPSSASTPTSPPPRYTKQSSFTKDFYESSQCDSNYAYNSSTPSNSHNSQYQQQQQYETYREYFDKTMADLSDDEMNEILGAAAMFSSIIGGIIGAKLLGGSTAKGGMGGGSGSSSSANAALSAIGSALGSAIASQAATTILKNSHTQAKQRALNADPSQRQREHLRDHPPSSSTNKNSPPSSYNHYTEEATKSTLPQHHWKDVVDNVMCGSIAKEAGKIVQQVVNDFTNGSNTHKNKK
jgi:curved DNA-binding protein CbpA